MANLYALYPCNGSSQLFAVLVSSLTAYSFKKILDLKSCLNSVFLVLQFFDTSVHFNFFPLFSLPSLHSSWYLLSGSRICFLYELYERYEKMV